jgi:cation-transporting ATPase E
MLLADRPADDPVRARANALAATGRRVLLLASADALDGDTVPPMLVARALVDFEEKVRDDAAATFGYFTEQGVSLRVISGDNPATVGAVAARAGVPDADRVCDARTLPEDPDELAEILEHTTVFGRDTPHQKRAMVQALQRKGHVVAMTGDGVNDALALKDADIGIAMGNGAAATRAVAQLVLLDGKFSRMPGVVAEGRRVIANVERVSNLYVTKTVYAFWFALVVGITATKYPFLPRHMTVVSTLTIGVPSFFLALAPNPRRYVPGFVDRVVRFTLPAGTITAAATLITFAVADATDGVTAGEASAVAVTTLFACGLWVLVILARPLVQWKRALIAVMAASYVGVFAIPRLRTFYAVPVTSEPGPWLVAAAASLVAIAAIEIVTRRTMRHAATLGR